MLEILHYPDPILKKKAKKQSVFDSNLKDIVKDMIETMHGAGGVGLAAPQVGVSSCIIILNLCKDDESKNKVLVMINPELLEVDGSEIREEGCLSVPDISVEIKRPANIKVSFQDFRGKEKKVGCDGMLARIILHEIDHLEGIIILDRISKLKGDYFKRQLKKKYKRELAEKKQ